MGFARSRLIVRGAPPEEGRAEGRFNQLIAVAIGVDCRFILPKDPSVGVFCLVC